VAPYVPTHEVAFLPADVQRWEPRRALDGGGEGIDLLRRVIVAARDLLRPGGWLLVEVGGDQDKALGPTFVANGFDVVMPWWDEDGDLRGIASQKAAS
jgi:release factor glutamine methyltransferase